MSKKVKKVMIEKKMSKKSVTHNNKSETAWHQFFKDLKQGEVVICVRKVRKVRLKKIVQKSET